MADENVDVGFGVEDDWFAGNESLEVAKRSQVNRCFDALGSKIFY